jgi:transcription elongation GreA/GreB family factor
MVARKVSLRSAQGHCIGSGHRPLLNKPQLVLHLRSILQEKVVAAEQAIASTRDSFTSDTKSSAGDKHEVGRAMAQQELDKLEEQRAKLIVLLQELARVPLERTFDSVGFGSLVATDQGTYFVAIGLGRIGSDEGSCSVISLASPIGQALQGKCVGDQVVFNGRVMSVQRIS